jgi:hypothetical protein
MNETTFANTYKARQERRIGSTTSQMFRVSGGIPPMEWEQGSGSHDQHPHRTAIRN